MSTNTIDSLASTAIEGTRTMERRLGYDAANSMPGEFETLAFPVDSSSRTLFGLPLSKWSRSGTKRIFDCVCVLPVLPVLLPAMLVIAIAVKLTSPGPALFLQKRMGRNGKSFTILKFRTMLHTTRVSHRAVTTANNQRFTPIGPFLRRWKLDELPQMLNVLAGHMSLVGPRPKMPEHVLTPLPCRPGITGGATIAFAREEAILDRIPKHRLDIYYHQVVLPLKRKLDAEYMSEATFSSDLRIIIDSVLRRWDSTVLENMLNDVFPADAPMQVAGQFAETAAELSLDEASPAEQASSF